MAQYQNSAVKPDAFFRGTARLLSDLSEQELEELGRLVTWASGCCVDGIVTVAAVDRDPSAGGSADKWPVVPWRVLAFTVSTSLREPDGELSGLSDPERLLLMLQSNGLARPSADIGWFGLDPLKVTLTNTVLSRLAAILNDVAGDTDTREP